MTYEAYPAGTLLIPSGPIDGLHLFIILTRPCANEQHLLVSVSSIKAGKSHDDACEFAGGEHEFIVGPSFIYYRLAEVKRAQLLTKCVQSGYYKPKADLAAGHFARVCSGVRKSRFVKPWVQRYFEENRPDIALD